MLAQATQSPQRECKQSQADCTPSQIEHLAWLIKDAKEADGNNYVRLTGLSDEKVLELLCRE
ncbi:MAG: hypothetical protein WCK65_00775 [Rhodospirillaceae bacterium]